MFANGINYANTLTRRREAYHDLALERAPDHAPPATAARPSIHDIEDGLRLECARRSTPTTAPCSSTGSCPAASALEDYAGGGSGRSCSWARERCAFAVERRKGGVEIVCTVADGRRPAGEAPPLRRRGRIGRPWHWDPAAAEPGDLFATELSLAGPVRLAATPPAPTNGDSTSRRWPSRSAAWTAPARASPSRCGGRSSWAAATVELVPGRSATSSPSAVLAGRSGRTSDSAVRAPLHVGIDRG